MKIIINRKILPKFVIFTLPFYEREVIWTYGNTDKWKFFSNKIKLLNFIKICMQGAPPSAPPSNIKNIFQKWERQTTVSICPYICRYLGKDSKSIRGVDPWFPLCTLSQGLARFPKITADIDVTSHSWFIGKDVKPSPSSWGGASGPITRRPI